MSEPVTMAEIKEKAFIGQLLTKLRPASNFLNGFGHDASVIDLGFGNAALAMKIDRAAKPVAAIRGWTDYSMWGRLAVTTNCSDLLATGARPVGFMLCVSIPPTWRSSDVELVVLGARDECEANNVSFLGGDTKESSEAHLVGSAIGLVDKEKIFSRRSARSGDLIVLAGRLGGFMGAYLQMEASQAISARVDWVNLLANPQARWREGQFMNRLIGITSATDASDGLYDALANVVPAGHGSVLDIQSIPYHALAREAASLYSIPLVNFSSGIGDWALLYTVSPKLLPDIEAGIDAGFDLAIIGEISERGGIIGKTEEGEFIVTGVVNEHFESRVEDAGSFSSRFKSAVTMTRL